jgi:hypothetical protein
MEGKAGVPLNFDRLFMKVKVCCRAYLMWISHDFCETW